MTKQQAGEILVKPIVTILSYISTIGLLFMFISIFVLATKMFFTSFIISYVCYLLNNFVTDRAETAVTNLFTEDEIALMNEEHFKEILKNRKR